MIFKNKNIRSRRELFNKYLLFFVLICVFCESEAKVSSTKKNALIKDNDRKKLNFSSEPQLPTISSIQNGSNTIQNETTLDGVARFHIPYHVSLQAINREGRWGKKKKMKVPTYEHLCAGTIIDEYYVLTAAHCFYKVKNPKHWRVVAGSNKLFKGISYNVTKIIIHDYFQPLMGRDIALLRIAPKFKFDGKTIEKINFFVTDKNDSNQNAYLIGWGPMKKKKTNKWLELISFRTINMDKCRKRGFIYVSSTELCAISYKGRGACDGDSGGPLVNTKFNLQLGILSYGRKPCMRGRIYAFTKLRPLVGWILKHIKTKKSQIHKTRNLTTAVSRPAAPAQARRVLKVKPH